MKTLKALPILFLLAAISGFGQVARTSTTLSAAMDSQQSYAILASATSVNAPGQPVSNGELDTPTGSNVTILYIDKEAMRVTRAVNGLTAYVQRATDGTARSAHASGATVWVGPSSSYVRTERYGACTLTSASIVPMVNILTGNLFYCLNGAWSGSPNFATGSGTTGRYRYSTVPIGSVAYASAGTDVAAVAGTFYCADVVVPRTMTLTGIAVLNGATGTTNYDLVALYDSGGHLVANSAVAGTLEATANIFQARNFTSTYTAFGPAEYFACVQANGNTGTLRMIPTVTFIDVLATSFTGVFGTVPATMTTVPTTFTADVGPVAYVF